MNLQTDPLIKIGYAVQNAPGKKPEALACNRQVLLRLKADPVNTEIMEQEPNEQADE